MTDARSPWDPNYRTPTGEAPTIPPPAASPTTHAPAQAWAPPAFGSAAGDGDATQIVPGTSAWERPGGLAPEPPPWSSASGTKKKKLPGAAIAAIAAGLAVAAVVAAYLVVTGGSTHTTTTPAAVQRPVAPATTAPAATAPASTPVPAPAGSVGSGSSPTPGTGSSGSTGAASTGSSSSAGSGSSGSTASPGGSSSGSGSSGSASTPPSSSADPGGCGCADIDPPAADNLAATPQLKQELADTLAAHLGIPTSQVDGTYPGTVYYGLDTHTGVNYAVAAIQPSAANVAMNAPAVSPYGFSAENPWAFEQQPGGSWEVDPNGGISPMSTSCPADFPTSVLQVWGQTPGACTFPTGP